MPKQTGRPCRRAASRCSHSTLPRVPSICLPKTRTRPRLRPPCRQQGKGKLLCNELLHVSADDTLCLRRVGWQYWMVVMGSSDFLDSFVEQLIHVLNVRETFITTKTNIYWINKQQDNKSTDRQMGLSLALPSRVQHISPHFLSSRRIHS